MRKFAGRLDQQLGHAREASEGGDLAEVERLAHGLAGAAGTVRYDAFTGPASELEAAAKAGDVAAADGVLQCLIRMADKWRFPRSPSAEPQGTIAQ